MRKNLQLELNEYKVNIKKSIEEAEKKDISLTFEDILQ